MFVYLIVNQTGLQQTNNGVYIGKYVIIFLFYIVYVFEEKKSPDIQNMKNMVNKIYMISAMLKLSFVKDYKYLYLSTLQKINKSN